MAKQPTEKERFEILLEDLKSQFKAVIEKVQDSDRKNEERFQELREEIKKLEVIR